MENLSKEVINRIEELATDNLRMTERMNIDAQYIDDQTKSIEQATETIFVLIEKNKELEDLFKNVKLALSDLALTKGGKVKVISQLLTNHDILKAKRNLENKSFNCKKGKNERC